MKKIVITEQKRRIIEELKSKTRCLDCGKQNFEPFYVRCFHCLGYGTLDSFSQIRICHFCKGTGELLIDNICPECWKKHRVNLYIDSYSDPYIDADNYKDDDSDQYTFVDENENNNVRYIKDKK